MLHYCTSLWAYNRPKVIYRTFGHNYYTIKIIEQEIEFTQNYTNTMNFSVEEKSNSTFLLFADSIMAFARSSVMPSISMS